MKTVAFIVASILLIGCKENTPRTEFLGMVNLEVTGNAKAVSQFETFPDILKGWENIHFIWFEILMTILWRGIT